LRAALRLPRLPRLVLPRGPRTVFSIGRSPDCDLPLGDITVSWRHAELRRDGQAWVLVDLGSTNGTRVNGWRVDEGFTVRAGDWVSFGRAAFRLTDHG
jgi:pSer/pThr/pTyr-binding forkhead associated (FHA) protein